MATSEILKIALAHIDKQDHIKYLHPETDSDMVNIPSDIVGGCGNRNLEDFLKTIKTAALKNAVTGKEGDNDNVPTVSKVGEMIDSRFKDKLSIVNDRDGSHLPMVFINSSPMSVGDVNGTGKSLNTMPCALLTGNHTYNEEKLLASNALACIPANKNRVYHFEFEADVDTLTYHEEGGSVDSLGLFVGSFHDTSISSSNVMNACAWKEYDGVYFQTYSMFIGDDTEDPTYQSKDNVKSPTIDFVSLTTHKGFNKPKQIKATGTFTIQASNCTPWVGLYFNGYHNEFCPNIFKRKISDAVKNYKFIIY